MSVVALADLAVGLALLGLAAVAWRRSRPVALLAVVVALTWWLGSLWAEAVFWHRGPLLHLLIAYPAVWPRHRSVRVVIVGLYAVALWPGAWAVPWVVVLLAAVLVGARIACSWPLGGPAVRRQALEVLPAVLVSTALVAGVVARSVVPFGAAVRPSFLGFCAALVAAAALQATGLRRSDAARLADVVVELGEGGPEGLRDELARLLGDPGLELGIERDGAFVDAASRVLEAPAPPDSRRAVVVARPGAPDLLLLHNASPWDEPVLRDAVERWARLSQANAELRRRARTTLEEAAASRRRLLVASDAERERLGQRIQTSVTEPLRELRERLAAHPEAAPVVGARLEELVGRLSSTSDDLAPAVLRLGLVPALGQLAGDAALPVTVELDPTIAAPQPEMTTGPEVERAAYYVCAEALANAAKHADATRVVISVGRADGRLWLTIRDDGRGGAVPGGGSGLVGLLDRVTALGGTLTVDSSAGSGTTVCVRLPVQV
jgi:signal transduction histidine kinase